MTTDDLPVCESQFEWVREFEALVTGLPPCLLEDGDKAGMDAQEQLAKKVDELWERIQGNRKGKIPLKRGDLRRAVEGMLRIALAYMESHQ